MPRPPLPGTIPSAVFWNRLEPLPRGTSVTTALEARLADPLWLLARQWQFGELAGADSGSAIDLLVDTEAAPLSRIRLGEDAEVADYEPLDVPLETAVEAEPVRETDAALAADAGLHFLRMLAAAGHGRFRGDAAAAYPFVSPEPPDAAADLAGTHAHWLLAGSVPDARAVAADLRATHGTSVAERIGVPEPDREAVQAVARAWLQWWDALVVEPSTAGSAPPAWDRQRLEYRFAVSAVHAGSGMTLRAAQYDDGTLDWPDVEVSAAAGLGDPFELPEPTSRTQRLLPTPVRFPGMPANRFWEIEDTAVSFAGLDPGLTDVGRVLLAEFGLVYGNDWFAVPLEAPLGTLLDVRRVTVTDTFGISTTISPLPRRAIGGRPWSVAELAAPESLPDRIRRVVPMLPTATGSLHGNAIERVELGRDEMANVVWAVERIVTGAAGGAVDRSAEIARTPPAPAPADIGQARSYYLLATPTPTHWVPYVPTQVTGQPVGVTELHRQARPGSLAHITAESDVLAEAEVPAGGVVVERAWQLARWIDGRTVLWVGRRVLNGTGPAASGLAWDRAIAPQ
jgi:hypothetical protein